MWLPLVLLLGQAGAADLPTIYGVQLGAAITLPECRYHSGNPEYGYDVDQPVMCAWKPEAAPEFGRPWLGATIQFPLKSSPLIIRNYILTTMLSGDRVVGIEFFTRGVSAQEVALSELTAKFGKPSSVVRATAMGASFPVVHATWTGPKFTVTFDGVEDKIDAGHVVIDTVEGAQMRKAADAAERASRPAL